VLFAASLGLITVASTGLWASTGFSLLLRWRFEIRILPIRRANFGPSKFPDANFLSRSPSRKGIPGEFREAAQLAAARGHRYVSDLRVNVKTQRHAQTGLGRAMLTRRPWERAQSRACRGESNALLGWVGDLLG
jgi:hypothetical protein